MGKSGTAFGIIGMILAAGAIGFAFVVWNGQNTTNSDLDDLTDAFNNLTQTIVVGIWDALDDNLDFAPYNLQDNWLFEVGDNKLNNTDYISVSNTNTRFTLLKSGWYRIHLNVLLSNIDPSSAYWARIYKNGSSEIYLDRHGTSATVDSQYHYIDSSAFVYSDGTNYIEINGYSTGDSFYVASDSFNQFKIEYIAT